MTPTGLEHPPQNTGNTPISETGGAKSGALSTISAPIDPDLQRLIDSWPDLPPTVKRMILASLETTESGK
jgi:hypothetical protein